MSYNAMLIHMASEGPHSMSPFMFLLHDMVRLAAAQKPNFVAVELGTNWGHSTVAIASGLAYAGSGHLHSCDIVQCNDAAQHIYRAGCTDRWTFYKEDSVELAKRFNDDSVDFVFLDTSHEYDQTKAELAAWSPKIMPGGRLVAHDTYSRPVGVGQPLEDFAHKNGWRYYNIDVDCGLGVMIRP